MTHSCSVTVIRVYWEIWDAVLYRIGPYRDHDDVIKWKHFPQYWHFVRGIHRSPVNFPHKGQWRGALIFSLICAWLNDWVNNREAGDLKRHRAHYDVIVMIPPYSHILRSPSMYMLAPLKMIHSGNQPKIWRHEGVAEKQKQGADSI